MSKKKSNYIIYTDGGCAINPGGPGGCAAVIINTETGEYKTLSEGYVSTTNNRMEMQAIIMTSVKPQSMMSPAGCKRVSI